MKKIIYTLEGFFDRILNKDLPIGGMSGLGKQLYEQTKENKKLNAENKINFILENPKANSDIKVIKFINLYNIKEFYDRVEVIADYIHLENDKLMEKDKIAIYKCYDNIEKIIDIIKNKQKEIKKELVEEKN